MNYVMLNKSFGELWRFVLLVTHRSLNMQSYSKLGDEMKILNAKKEYRKVLELFNQFDEKNIDQCTNWVIIQAIKACTETKDIERGMKIHKLISCRLNHDPYVLPSLIHFYMQCNDVNRAEYLYTSSTQKTSPMRGAMMKGYIVNDMHLKAIELFNSCKQSSPRMVTLFFNACARLGTKKELALVKRLSSTLGHSFFSNVIVSHSLLDAFIKCGDLLSAELFFDKMPTKTLEMYGALMTGFTKNGMPEKAVDLFLQIDRNALYSEAPMTLHTKSTLTTHNNSTPSNIMVHLCLIKALAQLGMSATAQTIIKNVPDIILRVHVIRNALIDMWGRVECVAEAKQTFETMSQPDHISYTAMISSFGLNGMGVEAVELYRRMPKEFINDLTHTCVLNACSHSGLLETARSIFDEFQTTNEITYTAMIDCLSRASAFDEAQNLIERFERDHPPSLPMYMSLLSAARNEKNSKLSEIIADRIRRLFPDLKYSLTATSILLANTYASLGDMEKVTDIKIQLQQSGVKRKIGVSLTEVDGKIMKFRAHDRSHPQTNELYAVADRISKELLQRGYKYDASWIMRPIDPDETVESVLCGHSERLAIAAHFLGDRKPKRIQITKNLRVCGDCHRATKLIASIFDCEIIVRDANRIHHFHKNGQCSCQDHF